MDSDKPLRRSKRVIKKKEPLSSDFLADSVAPKPWSRAEKSQLLAALEVFEDTDIASISEYIPTKTAQQVEYYIRSIKRKAYMISSKGPTITELEKWKKILSKGMKDVDVTVYDQFTLPLFFISLFESFPSPTYCDGIDFKAAYEFIFCIMAEIPPRAPNKKTLEFILKSFNEMGSMVTDNKDLKNYVIEKLKEAAGKEQTIDLLNPLHFPELRVPILPSNDSDEE